MRTNFATNPDMEASGALVTTRTNLCTNPNMEAAGPLVTTRTNGCPNPRLGVDSTGWSGTGWSRVAQGSGWAWQADGSIGGALTSPSGVSAAGQFWSASIVVSGPAGRTVRTQFSDDVTFLANYNIDTVLTGAPQTISMPSMAAVTTGTHPHMVMYTNATGGAWTAGQMLTITNVVMEKVSGIGVPAGPYFDETGEQA